MAPRAVETFTVKTKGGPGHQAAQACPLVKVSHRLQIAVSQEQRQEPAMSATPPTGPPQDLQSRTENRSPKQTGAAKLEQAQARELVPIGHLPPALNA